MTANNTTEPKTMNNETLLSGLCRVNGQQGGTIHQFFGRQDWTAMQKAYRDYLSCGLEFNSRLAFEKLADQYGLTVFWM